MKNIEKLRNLREAHIIEYDRLKNLKKDHATKKNIIMQEQYLKELKEAYEKQFNLCYHELIAYAENLKVREVILNEIYEQKNFLTVQKIERMLNYTIEDFNYLYEKDVI